MVSPIQLLCVLLLSRISAEIVFPQQGGFGSSSLAALVLSEVVCFLLALPVIIYSAKGSSFYGAIARKSRALGLVTGFVAAFLMSLIAARTVLFTAEFAQRSIITGMSGAVLAVLLGAFAVYAAFKGIEAISRAGLLFAAAAAILTAVVVLADVSYIELRSFGGMQPAEDMLHLVLERLMHCGEYLAFAAVLPYVRKRERGIGACGAVLIFALCSVTLSVLIDLFSMAVLGGFYGIVEYPFIAASGLADITLFKRLDGFSSAIWAACAALRSALLLYGSYAAIKSSMEQAGSRAVAKGEAA